TRCYRDWSSDVCSSDLGDIFVQARIAAPLGQQKLNRRARQVVRNVAEVEDFAAFQRAATGPRSRAGSSRIRPSYGMGVIKNLPRSEERRVGKEGRITEW